MARLRAVVAVAAVMLYVRVLLGILAEYWWYFPADFEHSAFLSGRRYSFAGAYAVAFYVHILSGPVASVLGLFLVLTGGRAQWLYWHRWVGRLLVGLVLLLVVPSGLVMAGRAYAGPIAGAGFAALAVATGACTAAAYFAAKRRVRVHPQWAVRCFLLLASPLVLRLASGMAIVMNWESEMFYQLNAWLSWMIPLAIYEVWLSTAACSGGLRKAAT